LWLFAIASVLVWCFVLPFTQPEQQLRTQVERLFDQYQYTEVLGVMSVHSPEDFPPAWEPPPHPKHHYFGFLSRFLAIMEAIAQSDPAPWVRQVYVDKFQKCLNRLHMFHPKLDDLERIAQLFHDLEEGPELEKEMRASLEGVEQTYYQETIGQHLQTLDALKKKKD
jgi:hypothetical protein